MSGIFIARRQLLLSETKDALVKAAASLTEPGNPPEFSIAMTALALHNLSELFPDACDSTCVYVRGMVRP